MSANSIIVVAVFATSILMALIPSAFGQRDYFRAAEHQYASSAEGSFEQFEAVLKMIDASYMYNMEEALQHSHRALQLARQLGDSNAEAVCCMYRALILAWCDRKAESDKAFELAQELFGADQANDFHKCHYYTAFVRYELFLGEGVRAIQQFVCNAAEAADKTDDGVLKMMTKIWVAFDSIVFGGHDPGSIEKRQIVRDVLALGTVVDMKETAEAFSAYVGSEIESRSGHIDGALFHLDHAVDHAAMAGNRIFEIVCRERAVSMLAKQGDTEGVRSQREKILELARDVAVPRVQLLSSVELAKVYLELGSFEDARDRFHEAMSLHERLMVRDPGQTADIYWLGLKLARRDGDLDEVYRYASLVSDPEFIDQLVVSNENYSRMSTKIVELEKTTKQAEQGRDRLQLELETQQAEASREIRLLQLAFAIAASLAAFLMLGTALLYSRRRLAETRQQLNDARTTSKRQEQIRKHLEQNVQRLQRMESLGILAGGVAHDFNNLLVGVICNAELTRQEVADNVAAQSCIEQVIHAAEKAAGLSRQMLAYAGKQKIEPTSVDLNELVAGFSTTLQATIGSDAKITIQLSDGPQVALCDPTQIEQVILNLVTNARDASPKECRIVIRTGSEYMETVDERYLFGSRLHGGAFTFIEVEDNGAGIPSDVLERIFEPFFSERGTGRGLGLAVVYGVVEAHDGLLRVTSATGNGTAVRVLLPVGTEPAAPTEYSVDTVAGVEQCSGDAPLILIVDDEPTVLGLGQRLVQNHGWKAMTARDGPAALKCIREHRDGIDCILLDVVMPELDAKDVLVEMTNQATDIPVILMSGFSETQLSQYREFLQVKDILEKPFRIAELEESIRSILAVTQRVDADPSLAVTR